MQSTKNTANIQTGISRRHAEVVHLWLQHINCINTNNAAHCAVLCCYVTALKQVMTKLVVTPMNFTCLLSPNIAQSADTLTKSASHNCTITYRPLKVPVCVCVWERERECVCVCVCMWEREQEIECVCWERERERECVCVCVCERERERERACPPYTCTHTLNAKMKGKSQI